MVSEDFMQRVRMVYPNSPELIKAIEEYDSRSVKEFLDDGCSFLLSPEQIIELLDKNQPEEVKELADTAIKRRQLYQEWQEKFSIVDE